MSTNSEREAAGSFIVDRIVGYTGHRLDTVGEELVGHYLDYGRGEQEDIRSTIVDMVADTGHFVVSEGGDAEKSFEAGSTTGDNIVTRSQDAESQAAVVIAALKVFSEQKRFDFEAILWLAKDHLRAERSSLSAQP
jgi:hypothetical protein